MVINVVGQSQFQPSKSQQNEYKESSRICNVIKGNSYVDDDTDSVNIRVKADEKIKMIDNMLDVGGFSIKY